MLNYNGYSPLDLAVWENDPEKAFLLIFETKRYKPTSAIRFIEKPNRLSLKYEKAFTLGVEKRSTLRYPSGEVKTSYVNLKIMKEMKDHGVGIKEGEYVTTTPLHLAAEISNDEAV